MGENTFSSNLERIRTLTNSLYVEYLDRLVLREAELSGLPACDLGGAFNSPAGWRTVDMQDADVICDLNEPWPFADNSVSAFRAYDIIEHIADKQHFMRELHRCLVPGGWALIQVPSTDGRGAFCDPTHVSFWNELSFWYYTRPSHMKYARMPGVQFFEQRLFTFFPSEWHQANQIPYVKAELRKRVGEMVGVPGVRL
jgi:SAM-dependent methyltransferase